jgi:large subunit ribosomal protein L19e
MSIKLTRRIAAEMIGRGESKVRIKPDRMADAKKAITRADVKALIEAGAVYAIKEKHNISAYSKILREKRNQGRRRGMGRRKGTRKARQGITYGKRVRGQRRILDALKSDGTIDNLAFRKYYRLVKGGNFATKATLLSHIAADGVKLEAERVERLRHM